ncbi:MAG: hypothetical protein JWL61_5118 [Gemmatimonadetes bacterium]|nr:hypothetical protein [Gemmatimonadota bacterium]
MHRTLFPFLVLSLSSACVDIPSAAPIVEQRWVVPVETQRITVANLLPGGVAVTTDSSGFAISVPSAAISRTLAQDCPACAAANGLTVPKPAFVANASVSTPLPPDISSATLTSGTLRLVITNNNTFDPLRPSAAVGSARGWAVITVSNGGTLLGKDSVNGATSALAANGGTLTRDIALAGVITSSSPVTVAVTLNSPAGDPVRIDASRTITATATPTNLVVANAIVLVSNRSVSSTSLFDLTGVDSTVRNSVQSGALILTLANSFNVTGTLTLRLTPSGGTAITKAVTLGVGTTTQRVPFSQAELQSLLGNNVIVTYVGAVNATSGPVTVSPKQNVLVTAKLDVFLEVGR